jgi:hypothetical protein
VAAPKITEGRAILHAVIDHAASGDNTLVAAVAGKKIRVISYTLVAAGAVTVRFESGASGTALTGQMSLAANGGVVHGYNPGGCFADCGVNTLLNLELGGAVSVDGHLSYQLIDEGW